MNLYHLQPVISEFQLANHSVVETWLRKEAVAEFMKEYGIAAEAFEKEYAYLISKDLIPMVSRKFECHEWPKFTDFLEEMHTLGVKHHDLHKIFAALKEIYIGMIGAENAHLLIHPIFNHDKIIIDIHRVFDYFLHKVLKFYSEKAHLATVSSSE